MSWSTIGAAINRLVELKEYQQQPLAVVLHGGEPLLLGQTKLTYLLTTLRTTLGPRSTIALQTNGTLLSRALLELFADTRTRVAVSIDGPSVVNDQFRVDRSGHSTFSRTVTAIERLANHPRSAEFFCGVLSVVDPNSKPEITYNFLKSLNVPSMDFLYRDGNHDRLPYGKRSFDSQEYGHWMTRLWNLYVNDSDPVPIECLDNLVRGLFGRQPTKEGTGISNFGILVVDTDGTITKNDTLKNSYDQADQFSDSWSIHTNSFSDVANSAQYRHYVDSQFPSHRSCIECPFLSVCGGGMVLHRWSNDSGYDNPSVYCSDQKHLFENVRNSVNSLCK